MGIDGEPTSMTVSRGGRADDGDRLIPVGEIDDPTGERLAAPVRSVIAFHGGDQFTCEMQPVLAGAEAFTVMRIEDRRRID